MQQAKCYGAEDISFFVAQNLIRQFKLVSFKPADKKSALEIQPISKVWTKIGSKHN